MVSSLARIFASTSQECNTVSPVARPYGTLTQGMQQGTDLPESDHNTHNLYYV